MQYLSSPHALIYLTNTSNISHAIHHLCTYRITNHQSSLRILLQYLGSFCSWFLEASCRINHRNSLCAFTVCPGHKAFEIQQRDSTPAHTFNFRVGSCCFRELKLADCGSAAPSQNTNDYSSV